MVAEEGQRVKMTSLEREIITFAKHFDQVTEVVIDLNMCTEACPCKDTPTAK